MKVHTETMINGEVVNHIANFCGIDVYRYDLGDEQMTLYFVKGDDVVAQTRVEADCGQNMGFLTNFEFKVE